MSKCHPDTSNHCLRSSDADLSVVAGILASECLERRRGIQREEMTDVFDGGKAVIWPIKMCLKPTEAGICWINLTLNTCSTLLNEPFGVMKQVEALKWFKWLTGGFVHFCVCFLAEQECSLYLQSIYKTLIDHT